MRENYRSFIKPQRITSFLHSARSPKCSPVTSSFGDRFGDNNPTYNFFWSIGFHGHLLDENGKLEGGKDWHRFLSPSTKKITEFSFLFFFLRFWIFKRTNGWCSSTKKNWSIQIVFCSKQLSLGLVTRVIFSPLSYN